ncbi:hypothetical protein IWX90DRAFT_420753 [Phyllosticta citrichinensis]|uniref:Uncharacterized protein n=1 Tax=Phyllosticta citrichinensis TaxID=1130410 RepID=A0ABR1Y5Z3_9PEZI
MDVDRHDTRPPPPAATAKWLHPHQHSRAAPPIYPSTHNQSSRLFLCCAMLCCAVLCCVRPSARSHHIALRCQLPSTGRLLAFPVRHHCHHHLQCHQSQAVLAIPLLVSNDRQGLVNDAPRKGRRTNRRAGRRDWVSEWPPGRLAARLFGTEMRHQKEAAGGGGCAVNQSWWWCNDNQRHRNGIATASRHLMKGAPGQPIALASAP